MMNGRGYNEMYEQHILSNGYMHYGLGIAIAAIVLILIVLAIVYLIRKSGKIGTSGNEALVILQTRFAKGEINEEEFKVKKKVLKA